MSFKKIILLSATLFMAFAVQAYDVVSEGKQTLVLISEQTIQAIENAKQDPSLSDKEKLKIIKSALYIESIDVSEGISFCEESSKYYMHVNMDSEKSKQRCKEVMISRQVLEGILDIGADEVDDMRKVISQFIKLLILFN